MASRRNRKAKGRTISVDFSNVEDGLELGRFKGAVEEVTVEEGGSGDYLKWKFRLGDGEGPTAYYNTSLTPQSLWNLRGLLECMGVEVPKSANDIDLDDLVGKEVGIVIDEEEYDGRMRAKMTDYFEWSEDDEKDARKKAGKKKPKDDEDDEDEEEDEKPRRRSSKDDDEDDDKPSRRRSKKDDDEDDEEDEKPRRRRRDDDEDDEDEKPRRGKKDDDDEETKLYSKEDLESADEKTLKGIVKRHDLDVSLSGSLRRQRERVINALEEAEMLEDDED